MQATGADGARVTSIMVALPIAIVTSYYLYRRGDCLFLPILTHPLHETDHVLSQLGSYTDTTEVALGEEPKQLPPRATADGSATQA